MASLTLTITNPNGDQVAHEKFDIEPELAGELIAQLEQLAAEFGRPVQVTHLRTPDGTRLVDLTIQPGETVTKPTFEQLYRSENGHD
jgi:hypothetical protein